MIEARICLAAEDCRSKGGWNADLEKRLSSLDPMDLNRRDTITNGTLAGIELRDFAMTV